MEQHHDEYLFCKSREKRNWNFYSSIPHSKLNQEENMENFQNKKKTKNTKLYILRQMQIEMLARAREYLNLKDVK